MNCLNHNVKSKCTIVSTTKYTIKKLVKRKRKSDMGYCLPSGIKKSNTILLFSRKVDYNFSLAQINIWSMRTISLVVGSNFQYLSLLSKFAPRTSVLNLYIFLIPISLVAAVLYGFRRVYGKCLLFRLLKPDCFRGSMIALILDI